MHFIANYIYNIFNNTILNLLSYFMVLFFKLLILFNLTLNNINYKKKIYIILILKNL